MDARFLLPALAAALCAAAGRVVPVATATMWSALAWLLVAAAAFSAGRAVSGFAAAALTAVAATGAAVARVYRDPDYSFFEDAFLAPLDGGPLQGAQGVPYVSAGPAISPAELGAVAALNLAFYCLAALAGLAFARADARSRRVLGASAAAAALVSLSAWAGLARVGPISTPWIPALAFGAGGLVLLVACLRSLNRSSG
ncbi:hypothetical protein [Corynebacterium timonense]|uniref:Uncharacterized protein n=1 Tax=Corynebacterium timonense TaxID=441500 RepID=A0A1H1SA04_9CORY|nr:hypothetical protein [Corynebacterium timonense]SDS44139.1 hypothetical protein SAMN04488539_1683 [Corynebacterium timonense]